MSEVTDLTNKLYEDAIEKMKVGTVPHREVLSGLDLKYEELEKELHALAAQRDEIRGEVERRSENVRKLQTLYDEMGKVTVLRDAIQGHIDNIGDIRVVADEHCYTTGRQDQSLKVAVQALENQRIIHHHTLKDIRDQMNELIRKDPQLRGLIGINDTTGLPYYLGTAEKATSDIEKFRPISSDMS